jgi:hypothetical protein
MKRLALIVLGLMVLTLPVGAEEVPSEGCLTLTFVDSENHPNGGVEESRQGIEAGEIRYHIIPNSFIWIQYGHKDNPDDGETNTVSWEISENTAQAIACLDGTLTLIDKAPVEASPEVSPEPSTPTQVEVDLVEEFPGVVDQAVRRVRAAAIYPI